jgi:hypothetical protein
LRIRLAQIATKGQISDRAGGRAGNVGYKGVAPGGRAVRRDEDRRERLGAGRTSLYRAWATKAAWEAGWHDSSLAAAAQGRLKPGR